MCLICSALSSATALFTTDHNPGYSGNVSPCDFKIRKGDLMGSHNLVDLAVGSEVAYNLCVGVR